jgi:hypothetical protein
VFKWVRIEKSLKDVQNENYAITQNIQNDLEEEIKRRKRHKADLILELSSHSDKSSANSKDIKESSEMIKIISEIVINLLEDSQICQALQYQDEEDRK